MKIARITTIGASAVLGLGLVLVPTLAQAAPAAPTSASASQTVDATAKTLPKAIDQTTYEQQVQLDQEIALHGKADFTMKLKGTKPGATVNVVVNGKLSTGVANKNGVARVNVTFLPKNNTVWVQSTKGGKTSASSSYSYDFTQYN